jgi:riboflavin kinase/FMN adenylyltransferase
MSEFPSPQLVRAPSNVRTASANLATAPARAIAIGNFDGVHRGHQAIVHELASHEDCVPTVLTFEPHPRIYFAKLGFGQAPSSLSTLRDRVAALHEAGAAQVMLGRFNRTMAELSAQDFIEGLLVARLKARHVLVGEDFRFGARRQGDLALLEREGRRLGFSVHCWPQVTHLGRRVSSSWLREALLAGDLVLAKALLGRPYRVSGHVIHGQKLGRSLGFPTINVRVPAGPPSLSGVLVVRVHGLATTALPGVASWGTRPAVTRNGHPLLEVHVLDWTGDAYGRVVQVDCLHKLRGEANFPSLDALKDQIAADTRDAKRWFATTKE